MSRQDLDKYLEILRLRFASPRMAKEKTPPRAARMEHRHSCRCAQRTFCRLCFLGLQRSATALGAQTKSLCSNVGELRPDWRVVGRILAFAHFAIDPRCRAAFGQ